MALRRWRFPLLDSLLLPIYLPDWQTEESIPAKAISFLCEEKVYTEPTSARNDTAVFGSTPSPKSLKRMKASIRESQEHLQNKNGAYFANRLLLNQYWRFFPVRISTILEESEGPVKYQGTPL